MKGFRVLAVVLACAIGMALFSARPAHAADPGPFNIVTSPVSLNLSGVPGSTINSEVRVRNNGSTTEKLKMSLLKFGAFGEDGKPSIQERGPQDDYFDWVTFTPSNFDAPPNEWMNIKVQIALPPDAAFGYYYAIVFSRDSGVKNVPGQNALVGSSAILALVEAKVPNAKRSAEVVSFTTTKRWYEFLPATFNIRLHNNGNVHVAPQGNIFITRGKTKIATLTVNEAGGNILPDSNRVFTEQWTDGFPSYVLSTENGRTNTDSKGNTIKSLHWDFGQMAKLRFGRYTAHMVLAYDDGKQDVPIESTVSFWVIPWRFIGVLIFLILLAVTGAWTIGRWTGRHIRAHRKTRW